MPIYVYQCGVCGESREVVQGFSGEAPNCCGSPMNKLPTAPAKVEVKGIHSNGYKQGYAQEYRRRRAKS